MREGCTFKIEALRTRPVSLVGLMLSLVFDRVLWFLGGLVPVPLFAEGLELEAVALKRDSPRTMVGEEVGGSPGGGRAGVYASPTLEGSGGRRHAASQRWALAARCSEGEGRMTGAPERWWWGRG